MQFCYRKCLALVFGAVITRELHEFVLDWNCHHIRHNRLADCPSGRPDDLYHMPNYYGNLYRVEISLQQMSLISLL